jgi:acetyl-CoA carboxylase biotin carboxylase subunit
MFRKVLIANRGEIGLRVIRACKELGIATVAVHSEADRACLHTRFADEDVCIGKAASSDSYLNISRLIAAAEITNADAIHPGYGFLAENADFAEACESSGIRFIGPSPQTTRRMGDKAEAKRAMAEAGVPVIPGTEGPVGSVDEARDFANGAGYPILLKAVSGGGGKGMRQVSGEDELAEAYMMAQAEAQAAFDDGSLYVEKLLEDPRHVEVQILADTHGTTVHLGERDCSIQRRHQKLIEESPSPAVDDALRALLGETAVKGARAVQYVGAGTVEFLLGQDAHFYFMEMNTRIQVEHPVTECVTGIDLVKEQIRAAAGDALSVSQESVEFRGWAIECRINAEDPSRKFMPCPGRIGYLHIPGGPGVRVDTHLYADYAIPPYYDSLIAKVIAHGRDRQEALVRMRRCLQEFVVEGVPTTIPFHLEVLKHPEFREGRATTGFLVRCKEAIVGA